MKGLVSPCGVWPPREMYTMVPEAPLPYMRDPHLTPVHISHAIVVISMIVISMVVISMIVCGVRDLCRWLSRRFSASTTLTSLVISALYRLLRLPSGSSDSRWTLVLTRNNHCYPRVEQHLHDRMVRLLSLRALVGTSSTGGSHTGVARSSLHALSLGRTEGPRRRPTV